MVDISSEVAQLLKTHLAGRTTGRVFVTKSEQALAKDNVRHTLHRILEELEIAKGGLHAFRHGRVSVLQANGVPTDLIKRWVGHSSTRVTSIYSHFSEKFRQKVAQAAGLFAPMEPDLLRSSQSSQLSAGGV